MHVTDKINTIHLATRGFYVPAVATGIPVLHEFRSFILCVDVLFRLQGYRIVNNRWESDWSTVIPPGLLNKGGVRGKVVMLSGWGLLEAAPAKNIHVEIQKPKLLIINCL